MIKADEIELLRRIAAAHGDSYHGQGPDSAKPMRGPIFATEISDSMGMHSKRLYSILDKWADRGFWDYGTSARGGWFTPEGWAWAQKTLEAHTP